LGFVASPLYLFGHSFQGKPTEHLLGPGITPDLLNDDRMGRMLDTLYAAGVTEVFLEVAREARQAFPFPVRALHADATSFHVHGRYEGLGEEVGAIRVTHGYSRDHRPDLKQWVMNLVCADTGGIPLLFAPGDGDQSDREALVPLLARYRQALDLGAVVVLDGAGYSRENLRALEGFSWIRKRASGGGWRGRRGRLRRRWGGSFPRGSPARQTPGGPWRRPVGSFPTTAWSTWGCRKSGAGDGWGVPGRGRRPSRWATASWPAWRWTRGSWSGRPCRPGRCWGGTRTRGGRWSGASGFSKTPCSSPAAPSRSGRSG
jgi:hypothetical protein